MTAQVVLSVSMEPELAVKLGDIAVAEQRNRSSLIVVLIKEALDVREAAQKKGKR